MAVLPGDYPLESVIQFPIEKVDGATFIMPSFGTDNDVQVKKFYIKSLNSTKNSIFSLDYPKDKLSWKINNLRMV